MLLYSIGQVFKNYSKKVEVRIYSFSLGCTEGQRIIALFQKFDFHGNPKICDLMRFFNSQNIDQHEYCQFLAILDLKWTEFGSEVAPKSCQNSLLRSKLLKIRQFTTLFGPMYPKVGHGRLSFQLWSAHWT